MEFTLLLSGLKYAFAALAGGGLWKVLDYYLQGRSQLHSEGLDDARVARELRDEMRKDIEEMRHRIDLLEQNLDTEREARLKAELHNQLLQAKIDLLLRMVNDLRVKEGLEPLTSEDVLPVGVETVVS